MHKKKHSSWFGASRGFTLIEILIVIGMLAILATVVLVAVNPLRQFAQARNSQRQSNVAAILNAVSSRIADNKGIFAPVGDNCFLHDGIDLTMTNDEAAGDTFDIRSCLTPTYLTEMPFDPSIGHNRCGNYNCANGTYNTGYTILRQDSRIYVCAPAADEPGILNVGSFCLSR